MDLFRDVIMNIILFSIFITGLAISTGHLSPFGQGEHHEKAVQAIQHIENNYCVQNKQLKQELNLNFIQHDYLIKSIQEKGLILHYDCGFKLTLQGNIYAQIKNSSWNISKLPQAQQSKQGYTPSFPGTNYQDT